jgi:hypothetical protein
MSTLPGGPADKAGLVHETLWGVYAMLKVLCGEADAICIEEPGVDGAEFFLQRGQTREHWQAKRQVLSQGNWSLQLLKSNGVLTFFCDQARSGNFCVFASISDAPELRLLAENASDAKDWAMFRDKFLAAKERRKEFNDLRRHWDNIPEQEVFEYLKCIQVEGARERTLESQLSWVLQATFAGPPQTALSVLHRFYVTSVHQTLTADGILKHLEKCGIKPREFAVAAKLRDFLSGITDSYLIGGLRVQPFQLPDPPTRELELLHAKHRPVDLVGRETDLGALWQWLRGGENISGRLLVGGAGTGKTRLAFELLLRVNEELPEWQAGLVTGSALRKFVATKEPADWTWPAPTLLVVDYAQTLAGPLAELLRALTHKRRTNGLPPLRVLLLERLPGDWFGALLREEDSGGPCAVG